MHQPLSTVSLIIAIAMASSLTAQSHIVVPSSYGTTDGNSHNWLGGASHLQRQQTLIGANHLSAMVNKTISAIEFRRTAGNQTFAGGTANMTVTISTSTSTTKDVSSTFANNIGSAPVQVFSGNVTLPTSPPTVGPTVNWTPNNVVLISFTTPFLYTGGRLCIDITGTPIAGQEANWWMADAVFEDIPGTVTDLGGGCGTYSDRASIQDYSLMVGGYAHMTAFGSPLGLAIAAIGAPGTPLPLSALGFTPPGNCNLMLSSLMILEPMLFIPDSNPIVAANGGRADFELKIPNIPGAQGLTLATQWFDWSETATTRALQWTITSTPTVDMALIEGTPLGSTGNVTANLAHVIRFEYQ